MKRYFFYLLFLSISLFGKDLTVQNILDKDFNLLKQCSTNSYSSYCDENMVSYQEIGINKTVYQVVNDSRLFSTLVSCANKGRECNKVIESNNSYEYKYNKKEFSMVSTIITVLGLILLVTWLSTFITIVNQKTAKVIEVFGKFSSVKRAGLNFKPPFPFGFVAGLVNLQIQELASNVGAKSRDNAFLEIPVKVQFKVIESKIQEAFYELDDPKSQMKSYIINMVRSKAAQMTMDELFSSKDSFETEVKQALNEKFKPFGYEVENVLVDDPQPSEEIKRAFNRVLAAEREKDAAINEAEALKIKQVGEARAEKESLILKGEAFKEYRARIAEGNIEAMGIMIGTHEMVTEMVETDETVTTMEKNENGDLKEVTKTVKVQKPVVSYKERENPVQTGLTQKDILNFFEGIDQREAMRDVGKNPSNTILIPTGTSNDVSNLVSIIEALKNQEK